MAFSLVCNPGIISIPNSGRPDAVRRRPFALRIQLRALRVPLVRDGLRTSCAPARTSSAKASVLPAANAIRRGQAALRSSALCRPAWRRASGLLPQLSTRFFHFRPSNFFVADLRGCPRTGVDACNGYPHAAPRAAPKSIIISSLISWRCQLSGEYYANTPCSIIGSVDNKAQLTVYLQVGLPQFRL